MDPNCHFKGRLNNCTSLLVSYRSSCMFVPALFDPKDASIEVRPAIRATDWIVGVGAAMVTAGSAGPLAFG